MKQAWTIRKWNLKLSANLDKAHFTMSQEVKEHIEYKGIYIGWDFIRTNNGRLFMLFNTDT